MERDHDKNPYTPDEARVAQFLCDRGIGGGDDPVGFILASHAYLAMQRNEARRANDELVAALETLMDQPTEHPLSMKPEQSAALWAAHRKARAAMLFAKHGAATTNEEAA